MVKSKKSAAKVISITHWFQKHFLWSAQLFCNKIFKGFVNNQVDSQKNCSKPSLKNSKNILEALEVAHRIGKLRNTTHLEHNYFQFFR